jgi:hypothetical protein
MGPALAIGGGGIGLVVLVVGLLLGVNPGDLIGLVETGPSADNTLPGELSDMAAECTTGADANTRQDCAIVGYVNSIQAFWSDVFTSSGMEYVPAQTVLFSGATEAACGYASTAIGPFYCPNDQMVYLDLAFFDELEARFGAQGGPFAAAYVLAHEYGHHVQNLLGLLDRSGGGSQDQQQMSIDTELQADCFAGVWVIQSVDTGYLAQVTDQEIAQALDTVSAVGDDMVQRRTQGYVSPETWTHGSSEQRQAAFLDGMRSGSPDTCETPGWTE